MADERDDLDLNIKVNSEGAEVADEVAKGLASIRKELKLLAQETATSNAEARARAKQLADELRASAIQISIDRKKARDEQRATEKAAREEERAARRQLDDEQRASARQLSADRKRLREDERAERRQALDEERAASRQIYADRRKVRDQEKADRRQALDEERASARQIAADRRKARDDERAAIRVAKDERVRAEREVNFELKKANAERQAYRIEEKRNATAAANAERDARRVATQQAREQAAAERARVAASNSVRAGVVALRNEVLRLAAAYVGFRAFTNIIEEGIEFNRILETAKLGIGSLIAAQLEMRDSNGRVIDGSEKLGIATAMAADQVSKLRVDSLKTVATTEQLASAFQQASGIGLRYGLTLDQIRKLAVQLAQAAGAVGVPLNQLSEEIRSLMQGTITPRNTRIATLLGITNADIKNAQQTGKLFEFITGRLQAFSVAGEATAKTFTGVMSNIKEALQTLAGTAVEPLFDDIRREGQRALQGVFDFDTAQISDKFTAILDVAQDVFGGIGTLLTDALNAGVEGAKDFNDWLVENRDVVQDIFLGVRYIYEEFTSLTKEVIGTVGALVQMGTEVGLIGLTLRTIAVTVATIHNFFQVLVAILGNVGTAILNLVLLPIIIIDKTIGAIVSLFNKDLGDAINKIADNGAAWLDNVTKGTSDYTNALNEGAGALNQFLTRVEKSDEVATKSAEAQENLSNAIRKVAQDERAHTKVLDEELEKKKISQEEYAKQVKAIELKALDERIIAQKRYFDSLDQSENKQRRRTLDTIEELKKRRDALSKNITVRPIAGPPEDPSAGADAAGFERAQSIRIKQELKERLRDLKIQLDQQLISYRAYYDEVTAAQTKALRQQAAALDVQAAATKKPGRKAAIQAQAAALRSEIDQITEDNNEKFRAATEKLRDEVENANIQLLKDSGRLAEARAIEVDQKFREKLAQLQRNGDFKGTDIITRLYNIDNAKVKLQELQNQTRQFTDTFNSELAEINTQVEHHVITETEGRERTLAAYIRTRDALAAQIPIMRQLALATKDFTAIQAVDELTHKFNEMSYEIQRLSDDFYELKEAGRQGLESGIAGFIETSIMNAKNWKDAWISAAQAVVGALAQVAAKMLANLILQQTLMSFMSLLGLGSTAAVSVVSPGVVNAGIVAGVHMAEGGIITGPGTGTSDQVPVWASNGEGFLNIGAVRLLGEEFINEVNKMGRYGRPATSRPGYFASGGIVDARPSQSPSGARNDKLTIMVRSNDSHILGVLESPEGAKVQVNNLRKNKVAVSRQLRK